MVAEQLNDAIEKVHDSAKNAVADVRSRGEDLRGNLAGYKDEIVSASKRGVEAARKKAHEVSHEAGHAYDVARDYAVSGVRSATKAAKGHPLTTVAIAAGVGLLIGAVLFSSRDR